MHPIFAAAVLDRIVHHAYIVGHVLLDGEVGYSQRADPSHSPLDIVRIAVEDPGDSCQSMSKSTLL
jgi:hypothetical protein